MKRLVSIILTLIIISTTVFSASAYTPIEPRVMAEKILQSIIVMQQAARK